MYDDMYANHLVVTSSERDGGLIRQMAPQSAFDFLMIPALRATFHYRKHNYKQLLTEPHSISTTMAAPDYSAIGLKELLVRLEGGVAIATINRAKQY